MENLSAEKFKTDYETYVLSDTGSARASATRASELGHDCVAYLAFTRLAGEKREKPDPTLASIWHLGRILEKATIQDLMAMGCEVTQQQRSVYWDKFQISGHIDGYLKLNGFGPVPMEIKSCSPYVYAKLHTDADLRDNKNYIWRKFYAQLQVYLLLESRENGVYILRDKVTGNLRLIPSRLDLGYAETLLKKAEAVKAGVQAYSAEGEEKWRETWLSEHRLNDADVCLNCSFKSLCLPAIDAGPGAYFEDDPEMQAALARRAELDAMAEEYAELDELIKKRAKAIFDKGQTQIICGDWWIVGKKVESTSFNIPKEVKQQYAQKSSYWRTSIAKIEGKK
jgi:hypothetical protein